MTLRFKKLSKDAVAPFKKHYDDAGWDLTVAKREVDGSNIIYYSNLAVEIPENYVGLLFPRSSVAEKDLSLTNCVGVVDSTYRGNVTAKFRLLEGRKIYEEGDRFCQLLILPYENVQWEESDTLSTTLRGSGGYGSTD